METRTFTLFLPFVVAVILSKRCFGVGVTAVESSSTCKSDFQAETKGGGDGNLQHLYTKVNPQVQQGSAVDVIRRLLPDRYTDFTLKVDPSLTNSSYEDAFEIGFDLETNRVVIVGTTGVSSLFGFNFYLKYFCNAHISWDGDQLSLPNRLPRPNKIKKEIVDRFRYYQNACTDSYSFAFYDWNRWEREIDWMALNGINLPLAFTGQEAIWERVYRKLGLSESQIKDYIAGPGFLAWWRMGNLQKWGGPIPDSFLEGKLLLLQKILERMRRLGMLPVLPAFAGHVPPAIVDLYPNSTYVQHPSWNQFNSSYSLTFFLTPTDPLFTRIGKLFLEELIDVVGTDHVYNADAYNENRPAINDTQFLQDVSRATFNSFLAKDPQAVWMMQGWTFTDFEFWTTENVRAFLSGVEIGNLLILDLQAETRPLFVVFDSFYNHKFIWCMLHNFGGTMNLFGNIDVINEMLPTARIAAANGTLVGIGIAPEGIHQNYVIYDFMTEMAVRTESTQTPKWASKYSWRRYGFQSIFLEEAWEILLKGVYNNLIPGSTNHGGTILNHRPRLNATEALWYNPEDLSVVIAYFLVEGLTNNSASVNSSLYHHDLVDFTRQFCIHLGAIIYWRMTEAYFSQDIETFWKEGALLLDLLSDLEVVLSTGRNFLLGKWTEAAEFWGQNEQEKSLMRFNSLNQITTWGPNGEIVDYAAKQWAGVISGYLKPRWSVFIDVLEDSLLTGTPFNRTQFNERILQGVEIPFTQSTEKYPTVPTGDSFQESLRIYKKWRPQYVNGCRKFSDKWKYSDTKRQNFVPGRIDLLKLFGTLSKLESMNAHVPPTKRRFD